MATRYSDFLDWIIAKSLQQVMDEKPSSNYYLQKEFSIDNSLIIINTNMTSLNWLERYLSDLKSYEDTKESIIRHQNQYSFKFEIKFKHPLIKKLFEIYSLNKWVDIEQVFFNELSKVPIKEIDNFNLHFEYIKNELREYLKTLSIQKSNMSNIMGNYSNHFFGKSLNYNVGQKSFQPTLENPENFYFVNFNYTSFLLDLLEYCPLEFKDRFTVNHIHGTLDDSGIIFGYGNETGEEFLALEKKENQYLTNIKSNNYFNTSHYVDLMSMLNKPYEVFIYGLSCGASDNILLKTIAQKSECKQIRIFYHRNSTFTDNHQDTLMNLSRVFENKEMMRDKIIYKQSNDYIPQT